MTEKRRPGRPRTWAPGSRARIEFELPVDTLEALRTASLDSGKPQWQIVDELLVRALGVVRPPQPR